MSIDLQVQAFLNGNHDQIRFGGYGGTITVVADTHGVVVRTTKPKRRQKDLGPNTAETRALAVAVAKRMLDKMPPSARAITLAPQPTGARLPELTPRKIWLTLLRSLLSSKIGEDVLEWGNPAIAEFLAGLTPAARKQVPSFDYIRTLLQAMRRLHRDGVVRLDMDFDRIETGALNQWALDAMTGGHSPHTVSTYLRRFRTAVVNFKKNYPSRWKGRTDPTENLRRINTRHIKPPELSEEEALALIEKLLELGSWQAAGTAMVALSSGRRVGAISGGRRGMHIDAPPLRADDVTTGEDGRREVTWRADVQKGKAYGRGDVDQVAPQLLVNALDWLTQEHPNPLGPQYPLIWDEKDPTRPASYSAISRAFNKAWLAIHGTKERGTSWHSFCRTVVTTVGDECGVEAAADLTGRSVETAARIYRRRRRSRAIEVVATLDELRGPGPQLPMSRDESGQGAGGDPVASKPGAAVSRDQPLASGSGSLHQPRTGRHLGDHCPEAALREADAAPRPRIAGRERGAQLASTPNIRLACNEPFRGSHGAVPATPIVVGAGVASGVASAPMQRAAEETSTRSDFGILNCDEGSHASSFKPISCPSATSSA